MLLTKVALRTMVFRAVICNLTQHKFKYVQFLNSSARLTAGMAARHRQKAMKGTDVDFLLQLTTSTRKGAKIGSRCSVSNSQLSLPKHHYFGALRVVVMM